MALSFNIESWIWYVFATGIIIARLISRMILFRSVKGLQADDWIMGLFVIASYTVLIVIANDQAEAQSNLLPPGFDINALTTQQINNRRYGSKIVVVVEQMQIAVIWACKGCLLVMYHRLTRMAQHRENIAIKILAVYVVLGYVVIEILYFAAWCRPFSEYWAVPTDSSQCNALINHRITKAVFNISSDVIMLCIALPMFIRSLLPLKRKLVLCGIFSLGIFVIAASILNSYYSFKNPYRPGWIAWYIRESSTAILVANLPFTWTLLRKIFNLGAFDEEHPPPPTYHSSRTAGGRRTARVHNSHAPPDAAVEKQPSPTSSSVSRTTSHAVSLITSLTSGRYHASPSPGPTPNMTSPHSSNAEKEKELRDEAIHPHDFAPPPPPPPPETAASISLTAASDAEISFQQALAESGPPLSASTSATAYLRPASPPPTHSPPTRTHLIPDGTGGFHPAPYSRSTSPPSLFVSTSHSPSTSSSPTHSRRPSVPSLSGAGKRPMSPVASVASAGSAGTGSGASSGRGDRPRSGSGTGTAAGTMGGGRSARDRRARARLSA